MGCCCTPTCAGINITFSGVSFCFCPHPFRGYIETPYPFNGVLISPNTDIGCRVPVVGNPSCVDRSRPPIQFRSYHDANCLGTFTNLLDNWITYVANISGIWYVLVVSDNGNPSIFFYGTTTDLSIPAANQVTCSDTTTWDNPLIECIFGSPQSYIGYTSGGIATFS